jgi:hypothetical protein
LVLLLLFVHGWLCIAPSKIRNSPLISRRKEEKMKKMHKKHRHYGKMLYFCSRFPCERIRWWI